MFTTRVSSPAAVFFHNVLRGIEGRQQAGTMQDSTACLQHDSTYWALVPKPHRMESHWVATRGKVAQEPSVLPKHLPSGSTLPTDSGQCVCCIQGKNRHWLVSLVFGWPDAGPAFTKSFYENSSWVGTEGWKHEECMLQCVRRQPSQSNTIEHYSLHLRIIFLNYSHGYSFIILGVYYYSPLA